MNMLSNTFEATPFQRFDILERILLVFLFKILFKLVNQNVVEKAIDFTHSFRVKVVMNYGYSYIYFILI